MVDKRCVRWFFQRLFRGFDDRVTWNLCNEMVSWLLPRLIRLRDLTIAHPPNLKEEEWISILDEMIEGFTDLSMQHYFDFMWDEEKTKKMERALDLFRDYFFYLWF